MRINEINFITLAEGVRKDPRGDESKYIKTKRYKEFLQHCIPYLAQVPVVSNKPSECLVALKALDYVTVQGEPYSSEQLAALIIYISEVTRSQLIVGDMPSGLNPRYGSLTPLLMFALKESKGIPYSYWDKTDPKIAYFLSSKLLCHGLLDKSIPDIEKIIPLRNSYISQGAKGSATYSVTGFNTEANINGVDNFVRHMLFQTWIANEDLRDTETMILDPINWDNIPSLLVDKGAIKTPVYTGSLEF